MNNPFKQSPCTWLVKTIIQFQYVTIFDEYFEDISLSIAYFEHQSTPRFESLPQDLWMFEIYFDFEPTETFLKGEFTKAAEIAVCEAPNFTIEKVIDKDWISEVQKNFIPFVVGNFYIHSSDYPKSDNISNHDILIDAARAFGTGEHQTTKGCLAAIYNLFNEGRIFYNMLDMGCGTGILAIAMAKTWQNNVFGVDIDPIAVSISIENAQINNISNYTEFAAGDGYNIDILKSKTKFDLITSNILANPLIEFASSLAGNLDKNGYAILSGLLTYQENDVITAHTQVGLRLVNIIRNDDWSTIIMQG